MTRKYIDCREYPSATNCSVTISADDEDELVEAAAQHAVSVHQHNDDAALRQQIRQQIKEGTPPEHVTPHRGMAGAGDASQPRQ